jgi:diacylglycerol kinase family enzyme
MMIKDEFTFRLSEEHAVKRYHIFNPESGLKHSPEILEKGAASGEDNYVTKSVRDGEREIYETCLSCPETHFVVYGGDGTVCEAFNGIARAGAGDKALLSVIPAGTGNDFVRSFPEKDTVYTVDALKYGDRYAANIINFGFDSNVVAKTVKYKKVFPGGGAYIAGVADTLLHKIGEQWQIELELENGEIETYDEVFTLALAANCQYYGGGFRAAPLADPSDGLIDFVAVRKVSKATFIRLVGDYKKGTHLDPETGKPYPKFEKYLLYRRCRRVKITGIRNLCADGEIEERSEAEITVEPSAVRVAT